MQLINYPAQKEINHWFNAGDGHVDGDINKVILYAGV